MCSARGRTRLHDISVLAGPVVEQALQNKPAIIDLSPSSSDIGLASHVKAALQRAICAPIREGAPWPQAVLGTQVAFGAPRESRL